MSFFIQNEEVELCKHGLPTKYKCSLCAGEKDNWMTQERAKPSYERIDLLKELHKMIQSLEVRVEALHCNKLNQIDLNKNAKTIFEGLNNRLDKLDQSREANSRTNSDIFKRIEKLESKTMLMIDIEENLKQWKWVHEQINRLDMINNGHKKPHKCPVCDGCGKFYSQPTNNIYEKLVDVKDEQGRIVKNCYPCQGKGILWG